MMARNPTNADLVVIEGDSAQAYDDWLQANCRLLLADVLSVSRFKTRSIVQERRILLGRTVEQWAMKEGPGGAILLRHQNNGVLDAPAEWHKLHRVVIARLLGYGDGSAVSRALAGIKTAKGATT